MDSISGVARPESKGIVRKNHEARFIFWVGRATQMRNADCGMRIEKENQKIRNPQSEIRNNWADAFSAQCPCFRATSLLFRRKGNRKSDGGQESSWLPRILPAPIFSSLGVRVEEFESSGSAGLYLSNHLSAYPPQREACEQPSPKGRVCETVSSFEFPRERPAPMEE